MRFRSISSRVLCCSLGLSLGFASIAHGQSSASAASAGSAALSMALASTAVASSGLAAHAGASMVVQSVRFVGSVAHITLSGLVHSGQVVIESGVQALQTAGTRVGDSVFVAVVGSFYVVQSGSAILARVPTLASASLLHSSPSR